MKRTLKENIEDNQIMLVESFLRDLETYEVPISCLLNTGHKLTIFKRLKHYSGQSKKQSLIESVVNVLTGYFIALISQIIVFPFFDIHVDFGQGALLAAVFTVISLSRTYVVRRIFNKLGG
jgi:hypothetical protein